MEEKSKEDGRWKTEKEGLDTICPDLDTKSPTDKSGTMNLPMEIQVSEKDSPGERVTVRVPADQMKFLEGMVYEKMARGVDWDIAKEIRSCIFLKQILNMPVEKRRTIYKRLGLNYHIGQAETAEQKLLFDIGGVENEQS